MAPAATIARTVPNRDSSEERRRAAMPLLPRHQEAPVETVAAPIVNEATNAQPKALRATNAES